MNHNIIPDSWEMNRVNESECDEESMTYIVQ